MESKTPECPQHPPWPAWAICSRCGGFICDECLRRARLLDVPESGQCPKCEKLAPRPIAFGGWLFFVGLQLVVIALACALVLMNDLTRSLNPVSLLFTGLQLGFSVFTAVAFVMRKRVTVPLLFAFYVLAIVASIVGEGTGRWVSGNSGTSLDEFARLFGVVRTVAFAGPWMVYLARAKRVTQTFVLT